VAARHDPSSLARRGNDDDDESDDDDDDVKNPTPEQAAQAKETQAQIEKATSEARETITNAAQDEALKGSSKLDIAAAAVSAAAAQVKAAQVKAAVPRKRPPPPPVPTGRLAVLGMLTKLVQSKLARLIATLGVIEWILIWIGREHHDVIAHHLAALTGVPAEVPPDPPRLRLDFGWVKMKGWRAVRFILFVALAAPVAWVAGKVPVVGPLFAVLVPSAWVAYWASVFAIANTFLTWDAAIPEGWTPWFLRGVAPLQRIPFVGAVFRVYVRVLTFATRHVWLACRAFEEAPWEAAGLALSRAVVGAPVFYLLSRPMFAPAATHALLGRRSATVAAGGASGGSGDAQPALGPPTTTDAAREPGA
jgi:hypothetical protein